MYDLRGILIQLQDWYSPLSAAERGAVVCFYHKLEELEEGADPLFAMWRRELAFTYGELDVRLSQNARLRPRELGRQYGLTGGAVELSRLVQSIQSFYSVLIKYIAYQLVREVRPAPAADLREILSGSAFRTLGVRNYCGDDWYAWLLRYWDGEVEDCCRTLWQVLEEQNRVTGAAEFACAFRPDSLKRIYETVMPRDIRHALGEYYTPDWLAACTLQLALDAAGSRAAALRFLDPTCGAGTFLAGAIRAVRDTAADGRVRPGQVAGFDINSLAVLTAKAAYLAAMLDQLGAEGEVDLPIYRYDVLNIPQIRGEMLWIDTNCELLCPVPLSVCRALLTGPRPFCPEELLTLLAEAAAEHPACAALWEQLSAWGADNRRILAAILLDRIHGHGLGRADIVAGNPPWVNWEYLPQGYRDKSQHLWASYGLFRPQGRKLRFLKEDISSLITCAVIDRFLADGGYLSFLLRQTLFKSAQNGTGFRRFRLEGSGIPFRVVRVEDLGRIKPFEGTGGRTALVLIRRNEEQRFPVPYFCWRRRKGFLQATRRPDATAQTILSAVDREEMVALPANREDPSSIWVSTPPPLAALTGALLGSNPYQARTGVFTGGANGVYWLDILQKAGPHTLQVRNLVGRARRKVAQTETRLEDTFLYPLVQGSDIAPWRVSSSSYLLLPHTQAGKMWPVEQDVLQAQAPLTYRYLLSFRADLDARKGFAGWEREIQANRFYAVLRVGTYTFSRYKVAWRYIAQSFLTAVITPVRDPFLGERLRIPNEKVMYVGTDCREEAFYLCGVLSATPVRYCIQCYMNPTSISTHVLDKLRIPPYDPSSPLHRHIAALCQAGHQAGGPTRSLQTRLDQAVCTLYGLPPEVPQLLRPAGKDPGLQSDPPGQKQVPAAFP